MSPAPRTPTGPPPLLPKPPRGIAALHGMHPKAHTQIDKLVDILIESNIDKPAMNFLVDETPGEKHRRGFGFSPKRLTHLITRLGTGGRTPHIEFYLSNGPWQRDHEGGKPPVGHAFGSDLTRQEFAKKIAPDGEPAFRQQFGQLASRLSAQIQTVINLRGTVYLVPMLEDNLDVTTFLAMKDLASAALGPLAGQVRFVRNPAAGDRAIPDGCFGETHYIGKMDKQNIPYFPFNGVYTNDGPDSSWANMTAFRDAAQSHMSLFIAFSGPNQGPRNATVDHRPYHPPTGIEKQHYLNLLRG